GWILGSQVRTVAQGVGEDSPAPPAPVIAGMAVNRTQLWESYRHLILFELTLTNGGSRELSYDGAKFTLLADGEPATMVVMERATSSGPGVLAAMLPVPWGYRYMPGPMGPVWSGLNPELTAGEWSVPRLMGAERKPQLAAGVLPPGGRVSGWLAFEVPIPGPPGEFVRSRWELTGTLGDHALKLDLSEHERDALEVKVRPATLDESVPVVEIAGRLNGLNVAEVLEVIDSVTREGKTPVLLRTAPDQIVDAVAARVLVDRIHRSLIMKPTWAVLPRQDQRAAYGETMASLPSENQAAIEALAWRRSNVPRLVAHLANSAEETRSAAARALGAHTEVEGVVGALLKAASDPDPSVRSAALASLAAVADPRVAETIIAAMDDPKTRSAAVTAAASQKSEAVVAALIKMLGDADPWIVAAACRSLGQQKSTTAVEPLKALQAHPDAEVARAAIDARKLIGELTPVDAALAKVAVSEFYQQDELNTLVRSRDPRAVPALVAVLKSGRSARSIAPIAQALGKLGDPRAVEPLKQALPRSRRFTVQLALIRLGVEGIHEQMIERLERAADPQQKRLIIEALGKAGRNESVAVIEPYLDDPQLYSAAALALLDVGSPEAMAPLAERLRKAEYRYGGELARQLFGLMYLAAPGESEPDESRDRRLEELLHEASASENEAVRKGIANEQASIDRRLTERQLEKLRFSLEDRRFDLAEEQFNAALERQLDWSAGRSEWQSLTGNWLIEAIVLLYRSGEANRADRLMQAAFGTLEARLGADRSKELATLRR
ncbi:MAG: HEAT repeat domain-containing protein, partial [Thermoguttaceae bacterium]|nr:HEAT repeat domain-containing protein [Thermoguttaceae bacterium]